MTDYQTQMDFLVKKWGPLPATSPCFDWGQFIRTAPIYDPDPIRSDFESRQRANSEGRRARGYGLPVDHVSGSFFDETLRMCWQAGWRWKDEELKGWRNAQTGAITALGAKNGL